MLTFLATSSSSSSFYCSLEPCSHRWWLVWPTPPCCIVTCFPRHPIPGIQRQRVLIIGPRSSYRFWQGPDSVLIPEIGSGKGQKNHPLKSHHRRPTTAFWSLLLGTAPAFGFLFNQTSRYPVASISSVRIITIFKELKWDHFRCWSRFFSFSFFFFFFLPHHTAHRVLVPWPGINPHPLEWKQGVLTTGLSGKSQNRSSC